EPEILVALVGQSLDNLLGADSELLARWNHPFLFRRARCARLLVDWIYRPSPTFDRAWRAYFPGRVICWRWWRDLDAFRERDSRLLLAFAKPAIVDLPRRNQLDRARAIARRWPCEFSADLFRTPTLLGR